MSLVSADFPNQRTQESRSVRTDDADSVPGIERRLEALAVEMREAIDHGPREEREALHAYAVSLIGERVTPAFDEDTEMGADAGALSTPEGSGTNAATLIGYGALLLPAGGFLALVLPPIGMTLALSALVLLVSGAALVVFSRLKRILA